MDSNTARRLLDLNRQFYQTFGREFVATRLRLQPGVRRILETLRGDEAILDLGCGNGGLARALARRAHRGTYTGLDLSLPLLEQAGRPLEGFPARFLHADLASPGWEAALPPSSFDLVTAFAVLHHIPGAELRLDILHKVNALLRPDGRFIHSEWQFLNSDKLKIRIQPWAAAGFSPTDVNGGDYLLDWRQGGRGLRYVHHFDERELSALAAASSFQVREAFFSDGEGGKLGYYQTWIKSPSKNSKTEHGKDRHLHPRHTCPGTSSLCECQGVQV
jgi:SAM-dependent methyltransferase